jgi:hypothetical protein
VHTQTTVPTGHTHCGAIGTVRVAAYAPRHDEHWIIDGSESPVITKVQWDWAGDPCDVDATSAVTVTDPEGNSGTATFGFYQCESDEVCEDGDLCE